MNRADPVLPGLQASVASSTGPTVVERAAPPADAPQPDERLSSGWEQVRRGLFRVVTRSLRRKLVAAMIFCLLPLAAVLAISISQRYVDRRAFELSANQEMAEALAVATEAYVRNLDHQLRAVGFALGRIGPDQPAVAQAYLALNRLPYADLDRLPPTVGVPHPTPYTELAMLALVDPEGQVVAADPDSLVGASLADAGYVRAALAQPDIAPAVVSDLLQHPDDAAPWFAIARPVRRPDGTLVGALVAYVDSSGLGRVLPLDRLERSRRVILDRTGRIVYDSEHPELPWAARDAAALPHVQQALGGQLGTAERFIDPVDNIPRLGAAAPIPRLGWVATADRPLSAALAPIDAAARQEAGVFVVVLLFALFVAGLLAHTLSRPVHALQAGVLAVGRGDLGRRVPVQGDDEVATLARQFNEMAARLEALEAQRQAFAAMVAHDLRSPLTVVRGSAQLLQQRLRDDPDIRRRLDTIVRETDRVARLAADLGDAASAAAGRLAVRPERVDLAALAREAVERLQTAGVSQPVQLEAPREPLWVHADPERIAQVLDNLLGNAAKYTPPDQPITVLVRATDRAEVVVADRGPGIPPEELPHLFERFYRTAIARRGDQKGTGLGLYISHEIARAHGGSLTAESAPGGGSRFTVALPLASDAPDAAGQASVPVAGRGCLGRPARER